MNFMRLGHILVLSFSSFPSPSRQGRLLGNLISALSGRFEADVLTIRESELGYVEKFRKHRLLRVPVGGTYMQKVESFQRAISRQLDGDEYDIIHFRSPWEGHILLQNHTQLDAIFIYEPSLSLPPQTPPEIVETFVELDRMSLELADIVIVPSAYQARQLSENPKWAPKVRVVHAGIDVNLFDVQHTAGLPPLDIIWVDNFMDLSASSMVFEGLARLREQKSDLVVGLVGPIAKPLVEPLVSLIARHELSDHVKFFGVQEDEDLPLLICRAKVGLVGPRTPSPGAFLREDCMNLLEYMACRVPAVAPRLPYITDITENGSLARLYAPDNSLDLSKNLLYMLHNPDKAALMAEDAYDTVRDAYTAAGTRRDIITVYADLLAPLVAETAESPEESGRPVRRRDSTISWRGHRTSSTGVGSPVPVDSPIDDGLQMYEMDTANIDIDEIQFEASGVLLGVQMEDEPTNPNHPASR